MNHGYFEVNPTLVRKRMTSFKCTHSHAFHPSDTEIESNVAASIACALQHNTVLKSFGIECYDLNDADVTAIASALEKNETLTHFQLENRTVGIKGADAIASLLMKNRTVSALQLTHRVNAI